MPEPRVYDLPMPEGGAEREVYWMRHHNCAMARALKAELGDDDLDLVQFSVGLQGEGMPSGQVFIVESTNPCDACGKYLRARFRWQAPKVFAVKSKLWTP